MNGNTQFQLIQGGIDRYDVLRSMIIKNAHHFTPEMAQLNTDAVEQLFAVIKRVNEKFIESPNLFYLSCRLDDAGYESEVLLNIINMMNFILSKDWYESCYLIRPHGTYTHAIYMVCNGDDKLAAIDLLVTIEVDKEYSDDGKAIGIMAKLDTRIS